MVRDGRAGEAGERGVVAHHWIMPFDASTWQTLAPAAAQATVAPPL